MKKAIFLFSAGIIAALFVIQSCSYFNCIDGTGEVTKVKREVRTFNRIILKGSADVFLKQGDNQSVVVETNEELQNLVETSVVGSTLNLTTKKSICPTTLKIFIVAKDINGIAIKGSGNITTGSKIITDDISVSINGSGDVDVDVDAERLSMGINGSGDIKLVGNAEKAAIKINGSGDINAFGLEAQTANVVIQGSGDVRIHAVKKLEVHVSGSGDVEYTGSPENIITDIRGSGSVKKR